MKFSILAVRYVTSELKKQVCQRPAPLLETQGGFEFLNRSYSNDWKNDDIGNIIENFTSLCTALYDVQNTRQAAAIVFLYLKTFYGKSVLSVVKEYLLECDIFTSDEMPANPSQVETARGLFHDRFDIQSGAEHWLYYLRKIKTDWGLVRRSPAFAKISKLISMCAALGLCNIANFNFELNGVRIFSIPAHQKHVSAVDFVSACYDTLEYFVAGGYECFITKSFDPLLFEDSGAKQFEDDYFKLCEYSNHVKCGNLEKLTQMSDNDYGELLDNTIDKCKEYLRSLPACPEKTRMYGIRDRLGKIHVDYVAYRVSGKAREAPFGIFVHGTSSVGKTYVTSLLERIILISNNFEAGDDRILAINESDKFLSTAKSSINVVKIDDMGNTKPDFVEKSPAQKVIELVNNVPYYANMADVDQKGKISLEPKVVSVTSNLELSRIASIYSMDVMSVCRRMLQIEQFAKSEFCIPGTKMLDGAKVLQVYGGDPYPDVYTFNVRSSFNDNGKIVHKLVLPEHCSLETLIKFIVSSSRAHFATQKFAVENSSNLASRLGRCNVCGMPTRFCTCYHKDSDDVSIDMEAVQDFVDADDFEKQAGHEMRSERRRDSANMPADYRYVMKLFYYMPDSIFYHPICQFIQTLLQINSFIRYLKQEVWFYMMLILLACWTAFISWFFCASVWWVIFCLLVAHCKDIHDKMAAARADDRNFMPSTLEVIKRDRMAKILAASSAIALLWKIARASYTLYKSNLEIQGSLTPTSEEEIIQRDLEKNPWVGAYIDKVPQSTKVDACKEHVENAVESNLMYMRIVGEEGGNRCCNAIGLKGNWMSIPTHMFLDGQDSIKFELYKAKAWDAHKEAFERKYVCTTTVMRSDCEEISDDMTLCYVPQGNTWRDITKFLPDGSMKCFSGTLLYRDMCGDLQKYVVECDYTPSIMVGRRTFQAYKYNLPIPTFKGLCMATLISDTKPSVIAGFHLGGKPNHTLGAAGLLLKGSVQSAIDKIVARNDSFLEAHSGGDLPTTIMGKQILTSTELHPKSCMHHMPIHTTHKVYGQTIGRAKQNRSDVIVTPISEDVERICGVPNQFGPPKFHSWRNYSEGIKKLSLPSMGFRPDILKRAVDDYLRPLLITIKKDMWTKTLKPLTWIETLSGIDGVRFIDAMPKGTSIGFPFSGAKKNYMIALNPDEYPNISCPMDIDESFKEEFERCKEVYLKGERCYHVFKAALKDEPTKKTKEKVRVFFAAPFVLQAFIRKYFLPICRFISMNPLLSECALGINAQGPEWDELVRHMKKHGDDRIFAGDYSDYDTHMPAQISCASYNILIKLAKATGNYTDEDLLIMRGVCTDCVYPVVAYNGDLVEFTGVHISGVNVTAVIGSTDNSLQQRCGYFELAEEAGHDLDEVPEFRENASNINLGDDVKGSVSKNAEWFNHISYADYLKRHGMVFTMPDKSSEPTKYMHDTDADFLKRKNLWNEETQLYFGTLDKSSIFKSLHCVLKSGSVTPLQQCAMNIDGALREMFTYGREDYETLREQLTEIAEKHKIKNQCVMLDQTYDDRMEHFKETYLGKPKKQTQDFSSPILTLDCQGGLCESIDELAQTFDDIELDQREISREIYSWRNAPGAEPHENSDRPIYNDEKYYCIKRSKSHLLYTGFDIDVSEKWLLIPRSKKNFVDLIKTLHAKPAFYQDVMTYRGEAVGDVDLGFVIKGDLFIFEIKKSPRRSSRANAQAKLNLFHLQMMNQGKRIHSFSVRGDIVTHVASNCTPTRKQLRMGIF